MLHFVPFVLQRFRIQCQHTFVIVFLDNGCRCIHRVFLLGDVFQLSESLCRTTESIEHFSRLSNPILQFRCHTHAGIHNVEFLERMLRRMTRHVEHGIECFQLLCIGLQVVLRHAELRVLLTWQLHCCTSNREPLADAIIERQSSVLLLLMECIHIANELLTLREKLLRCRLVFLWCCLTSNVHRALHLTEEMGLGGFVRMHFKAERTCAHLGQTFLHHLESCHFLCHEKHTLAVVERIGNHICDGLTLSRTWRSIEKETLALARLNHRLQLTAIHIERHGK